MPMNKSPLPSHQLNELLDGPAVGSAQAGVTTSTAQRDAAQANFEAFADGATATAIAAAEAQLAQAEAALNALVDGLTAADIRSAEAQVEQARLNVEAAQEALDKATLHALSTALSPQSTSHRANLYPVSS